MSLTLSTRSSAILTSCSRSPSLLAVSAFRLYTKFRYAIASSKSGRHARHRQKRHCDQARREWNRCARISVIQHEELRSSLRSSILLVVGRGRYLQNGEEGFLRNVHLADALHAALAFFLFFEEFAFARNVAAVALGENVLADGGDGFARDHAAANRGLDRDFKHLPRNELSQARHQIAPALSRKLAMDDQRQRVDRFAGDQHIQFDEIRFDLSRNLVIERGVAALRVF